MSRPVARFQIMSGLPGCLPNSADVYAYTTRREVVSAFRDYLEFQGLPAYLIHQIKWRDVWHHIKRYGASSLHLCVQHKNTVVEFAGLTENEYNTWVANAERFC